MAIAKKVAINDVAQAAGASVSIVSLALSGKGRIPSTTGERVNQAIGQLGFVRNRQAASLRGEQSGVIGPIVSDLSGPFYVELTAGLTNALERWGKIVLLTQGGCSGEKIDQRFDTLAAQGVDGVIITRSIDRGGELRERTAQADVSLVFASRASHLDDVDLIRPDNIQAAQLMAGHLIRHDRQRITWFGGQSSSLTHTERAGGYCATLLKYSLLSHNEWVLEYELSQKQTAEAMAGLLRQGPTITVVLCYNNVVTTGAWLDLLRTGRQSREDGVEDYFEQRVALAAFANMPEAALDDLPFTWVTTPTREMGKILTESILRRLEEGTDEARNQIMPPRLVTRK